MTISPSFDPSVPVVVFLGPSLSLVEAKSILPANYLGPAQLGDVYQLIGLGLDMIVLIDGLFHVRPAVWPREILQAIDSGITVIGASSMGALRAAELCPYGMIGHGKIFEWFRDGILDGDDEVALLHTDRAEGFRMLSHPLVDIRHNLTRAAEAGAISQAERDELVTLLKREYFGTRSYQRACIELERMSGPGRRQSLENFLTSEPPSLKAEDASSALRFAAGLMRDGLKATTPRTAAAHVSGASACDMFRAVGCQRRAVYDPTRARLVSFVEILSQLNHAPDTVELATAAARRFFVGLWIDERKLCAPPDWIKTYEQRWREKHQDCSHEEWLSRSGSCESEFRQKLSVRAREAWVLERGPAAFEIVLDVESCITCADRLATERINSRGLVGAEQNAVRQRYRDHGEAAGFVSAWGREVGARAPASASDVLRARVGDDIDDSTIETMALAGWIIEQGPRYFGYLYWSDDEALIDELRFTGGLGFGLAAEVS